MEEVSQNKTTPFYPIQSAGIGGGWWRIALNFVRTHTHNAVFLVRKIYLEIKTVIPVLESFYSLTYPRLS